MNYEIIRPTIHRLLNDLKKQKILIFHNEHHKKYAKRELMKVDFNDLQISAIRKIGDELTNQTTKLTLEEFSALMLSVNLFNIITMLEELKNRVSDFLDPNKIKLDDNPTYGVLINRIADKLSYGNEDKNKLLEIFLVDFRNSLAHSDYELSADKISYRKKTGKIEEYTIRDMANVYWGLNEITRTILNYQGIDTSKGQIGSSHPYNIQQDSEP